MTPARFRWGILLITIGALFLLRNMRVLNDDMWLELLVYSPVVLIAIGIEKIFTKTKLRAVSYGTSLFLLVAGLAIAFNAGYGDRDSSFFSRSTKRIELEPQVKTVSAELKLGETDLTIRDSGEELMYGRFDRFTVKPRISYSVDGDGEARVTLKSRSHQFLGNIVKIEGDGATQDWYLRFNEELPLQLDCTGEQSDMHLNLSTTRARNIRLDADNSYIYLKLGELEPMVRVKLLGDNSDIKLRLPQNIGLRVWGNEYANYLERLGLFRDDEDYFVTEGIDTARTKVELDISGELSSFSIDFF